MADIAPQYNPTLIEEKWYAHWMEKNYFHSEVDDREPYTIVIPPPNVTGVLHMGHMLNNTIQDVLIRRARLQGKNACWVPGTDHASIATEAKVVKMLEERGIKKEDISREEFLGYAFEWKDKYGGIILDQLKRLGASCDWERTRFTMEDSLSDAVKKVFIDLYEKGLIYRGKRMVNWDPKAKTALSDEEVNHKEKNSKLFHVRYQVEGTEEFVTIATTRPETILADSAIAFHPEDERYHKYKGMKAIVPISGRSIPFIFDEYVDIEYGTGALKITPAHDPNDYILGEKHGLEIIDMLNEDATLNSNGLQFENMDRFPARRAIVKELEELDQLVQIEVISNKVGFSERTDEMIEPRLTYQWFLEMPKLAKPALDAVISAPLNDLDGRKQKVNFHPKNQENTYKYWMENIRDWCISRQLWWGQQIPAYFYGPNDADVVVAESKEAALEKAKAQSGNASLSIDDLQQDPDVVDTWFSSWLWPISVFDGFQSDNEKAQQEIDYYYPTQALVTAPDIIFFWVARMIMAGLEYRNEIPFDDVYFTGVVRDSQRRKMSKSLGNSPDPFLLMDKYGADGVRVGMLFSAPAGNDLLFDEKLCEQGSKFNNKVWNALRLIKGLETTDTTPESDQVAIDWFQQKLNGAKISIDQSYSEFRISEALQTIYNLIWSDFCSWYLELVKPGYEQPISVSTKEQTIVFLEELMQLAHPFMPFISEEIWHLLRDRVDGDDIIVSIYPENQSVDAKIVENGEALKEMITAIREVRAKDQLKNQDSIDVFVKTQDAAFIDTYKPLIQKLTNSASFDFTDDEIEDAKIVTLKNHQLFVVTGATLDAGEERAKIEEELKYNKGFLTSIEKKLSNERFVNNAPEAVVAKERQKMTDAENKIKALEEQLAKL